MEVDGEEEEEISSELKQTQLVCYITVLGQAWPNTTTTQGKYPFYVSCLLPSSLPFLWTCL